MLVFQTSEVVLHHLSLTHDRTMSGVRESAWLTPKEHAHALYHDVEVASEALYVDV